MSKDLNRILRDAKRHPAFRGYDRGARARAIWTRNLRHPEGMVGAACADPRIALIQVNEALRSSRVPACVVDFLIWHELAHIAEPAVPVEWGGSPGGPCAIG